jgi:hypothetical protein
MTWRNVKDGLPDKDGLALVSDGQHVTLADWTRTDGWLTSREDGVFGITNSTITHWMPLPEPPISEDQET